MWIKAEIESINVSNQPTKRARGRPKGSRNKRKLLSTATVREICDFHKFNPIEKLIRIAQDDDWDENGKRINWPQLSQQRATEKLADYIHGNKRGVPGELLENDNSGQYNLVFIEASEDFQLPGEAGTEGAEVVLRPEQVQRAGLPQAHGEDGLCGIVVNQEGTDVSS